MKAYTRTHVGRVREQNEDTVCVCPGAYGLYILADGMGGHLGGEVASALAAQTLTAVLQGSVPSAERLAQAFARVNTVIYEKQKGDPSLSGMGTTLTVLWEGETHVYIGHVGDSRAYLMMNGRLRRMTEDHSLVEEMVSAGMITEEQAKTHPYRSVITRAMGTDESVQPDVMEVHKSSGERWLLCSDGLSDMVEDEQIEAVLRQKDAQAAAGELVERALENGGRDNISVMVLEVEA